MSDSITEFTKKIIVIVIYLVILVLLWLAIRYRYGITTESFSKVDNFKWALLRNIPVVNDEAKKYATLDASHYLGDKSTERLTQKRRSAKEGLISDDPKDLHSSDLHSSENHTYGTLLRNIPIVNDVAKKFTSVRPQKLKSNEGDTLVMPKELNGPVVWKDYLSPITEQGKCGNCWAHASTNTLADRFAILSLGQVKFIPSPYDVTICGAYQFTDIDKQWNNIPELQLMDDYFQGRKADPNQALQSAACEGAALYTAANILYTEGVTDISCFPGKAAPTRATSYDVNMTTVGNSKDLPYCYKLQTLDFDTCVDQKTAMKKYRAKTAYNVGDPENDSIDDLEQAIMHEIYRNGPIVSGFVVFDDFMDPLQFDPTTIYQHKNKAAGSIGGHAIKIVGWGEDTVGGEVIPYWWIANSWGKAWGINGYFKMKRKMPECQLEMNGLAMLPDFPGMVVTDDDIIPIETSSEINTRNFTKHYLDPTSGYYTSAMDKVKNCKLSGEMIPYTASNAKFPEYETFYAANINDYVSANPLETPSPRSPLVTCSSSPTPTGGNSMANGIVQPANASGIVQPEASTVPVKPPTSAILHPPKKVCIMEPHNSFTWIFDKIAKDNMLLNLVFLFLAGSGSLIIWKMMSNSTPLPSPVTPSPSSSQPSSSVGVPTSPSTTTSPSVSSIVLPPPISTLPPPMVTIPII